MIDELGVLLSLIALAAGYWVLLKSSKEEKFMKDMGAILGWGIMGISLLFLIVSFYRIAFLRSPGRLGVMGRNRYTGSINNMFRRESAVSRRFAPPSAPAETASAVPAPPSTAPQTEKKPARK